MHTGNRINERFMWKGIWNDVKGMVWSDYLFEMQFVYWLVFQVELKRIVIINVRIVGQFALFEYSCGRNHIMIAVYTLLNKQITKIVKYIT